jgi:hypothetical protein
MVDRMAAPRQGFDFVRPDVATLRRQVADQLRPVMALHTRIAKRLAAPVNVEGARERVRSGRIAFDPRVVIACAGNLESAYLEAVSALEDAGLVGNGSAAAARGKSSSWYVLLNSWASGELRSFDDATATARFAASLVGRAVLRHASDTVRRGETMLRGWTFPFCPCCGGAPDLALTGTDGLRALACVRCDTEWETTLAGCLGCAEVEAPAVSRIETFADLEYRLLVCSPCARYIKEGPLVPPDALVVERTILAAVDAAAKRRGLRF